MQSVVGTSNELALHSIELFAGVGMLGEGLRAGLGHLGITNRVFCYVEREAYAAAVLASRIEEGALDSAPVWSDVCTFDARIATDCGAWLIFLENVAGIASATASVVDAEEGELDERAAARVVLFRSKLRSRLSCLLEGVEF